MFIIAMVTILIFGPASIPIVIAILGITLGNIALTNLLGEWFTKRKKAF